MVITATVSRINSGGRGVAVRLQSGVGAKSLPVDDALTPFLVQRAGLPSTIFRPLFEQSTLMHQMKQRHRHWHRYCAQILRTPMVSDAWGQRVQPGQAIQCRIKFDPFVPKFVPTTRRRMHFSCFRQAYSTWRNCSFHNGRSSTI